MADDFKSRIEAAKSKGYSDDEIVSAIANGKPEFAPRIKAAKQKGYSSKEIVSALAQAPATSTVATQPMTADSSKESFTGRVGKDLSIGWRSQMAHAAHTAANAASMVGAKDTSEKLNKWSQEEEPTAEEVAGKDSVFDKVTQGVGGFLPGAIEFAPAIAARRAGPAVAGVIGAIGAKDQGFKRALITGAKDAAQFRLMEFGGNFPTRLGRAVGTGAIAGGYSALVGGGSAKESIANALIGATVGGLAPNATGAVASEKVPLLKALKQTFMPTKMSEAAAATGRNIAKSLAERERMNDIAHYALEKGRDYFDKQSVDTAAPGGVSQAARRWFKDYQTGNIQRMDKSLRPYGEFMKEAFEKTGTALHDRNLLQTFRDNFMSQMWTRDGKEDPGVFALFKRNPLTGAGKFQKQRVFESIEEGLDWIQQNPQAAKGLKLLTNNPIEMGLLGLREQHKMITTYDFMHSQLDQGLLEYVQPFEHLKAANLKAQGWVPAPQGVGKALDGISIELAKKNGLAGNGSFYMPKDSATIIENLMAQGARSNPLTKGALYGTGSLNKAQLSMTSRHYFTTALEAAIGRGALAQKYLVTGLAQRNPRMLAKALRSTGEVLTAPIDPLTNALTAKLFNKPTQSGKLVREFLSPGSYPEMATMAKLLVTGGGRAGQEAIYRAGDVRAAKIGLIGAKQIAQMAWKERDHFLSLNPKYRGDLMARMRMVSDATKMASGMMQIPGAVIEGITAPIFEYAVPMFKFASYSKMMEYEMARLEPELNKVGATSPAGQQLIAKAARNVWDSVDNRLGTFVYDNLAWNTMLKNVMMITFRSVGWRLGTLREIGGGVLDWKKATTDMLRGKSPEFTHRMAYTIALPVVVGVVGGIANKLMTGENPKSLQDLYRPRTGDKDENGNDKRIDFASYMNDLIHVLPMEGEDRFLRVKRYVQGALNPGIEVISELLRNSDFNNNQIIDKDGTRNEQLEDALKYATSQFVPISLKGMNTQSKYKGVGSEKYLPTHEKTEGGGALSGFHAGGLLKGMTGVNPAPADEMKRPFERYADEHPKRSAGESQKPETASRTAYRKDLFKAFKYKDEAEFRRLFDQAVSEGIFQSKDERLLRNEAKVSAGVEKFQRLGTVDKLQSYLYAVHDAKVSDEEKNLMMRSLLRELAKNRAKILNASDNNEQARRAKIRLINGLRILKQVDKDGNFTDFTDDLPK